MNEFILGAASIIGLFALDFCVDSIVPVSREIHEMKWIKIENKIWSIKSIVLLMKKPDRFGTTSINFMTNAISTRWTTYNKQFRYPVRNGVFLNSWQRD